VFIKNETIIFESSYDIDHVFSSIKHKGSLGENNIDYFKDSFVFELSLIGIEYSEDLFDKKIQIIKNQMVKDFPTEYNDFNKLLIKIYEERNNTYIVPYYGIDIG